MIVQPRDYQREWIAKTHEARAQGFSRLLLDAVGGSGKTVYAGALAHEAWTLRQGRTLILENRQQLVEQTAERIRQETGLEVDVEMDKHRASPHVPVVVASVASLGRINRLTGFSPGHFEYVFADECHNSMAELFLRVMRWFHYGAESLNEGWQAPKDGTYAPNCCVIGISATLDNYGKRNLGNFYQKVAARYSYLQAISDGWLVGLKEINIPVRIDTRSFKRKSSTYGGSDFSAEDQAKAIIPVIEKLADQIVQNAATRKTMCFLPSKECVLLMHEALNRREMKCVYVLGDCLERDEKTDYFKAHGPGIVLILCAMYVEGTDIPTADAIAWFRATESPTFYKQGIMRCSRTLPGLVHDAMSAEERRGAIASSAKQFGLVISPFYVSLKINIMSVVDLFVDPSIKSDKRAPADFTDAAAIRDYIKALEKAADKHAHRQPRTIDPVVLSVSLGLRHVEPQNAQDAAPPSREELDFLLASDVSSVDVKTSAHAQQMIATLRLREQSGLCTPKQLQLLLKWGFDEERAVMMKKTQAGAIIGKKVAGWR